MEPDELPLRIGISSCLLGNQVRYDAGHKHCAYITQTLDEYFEFIPFCPEVAIGLGIPRPLAKIATAKQHANVLMHIMGFLKADIDSDDKAELLELIDTYRQQQVPLIAPMTLIHHQLRCHP